MKHFKFCTLGLVCLIPLVTNWIVPMTFFSVQGGSALDAGSTLGVEGPGKGSAFVGVEGPVECKLYP